MTKFWGFELPKIDWVGIKPQNLEFWHEIKEPWKSSRISQVTLELYRSIRASKVFNASSEEVCKLIDS
jgi:hypothetical protein